MARLKTKSAAQLTRRKTLFPINSRQIFSLRCEFAWQLKERKFSFYAIRQILKCTPDEARRLVARSLRLQIEKGGA